MTEKENERNNDNPDGNATDATDGNAGSNDNRSDGNADNGGPDSVNRSGNGPDGGNNRSGNGSETIDSGNGSGNIGTDEFADNGSSDFAGKESGRIDASGRIVDGGGNSGDGNRNPTRTRKPYTKRRASSDTGNDGNGQTEGQKLVFENADNVKPKTGSFKTAEKPGLKFKRGYRPLMDKAEATQTVDGLFGLSSLFLGEHWILTDDEAAELGKQIAKVCEKFPVKVGENPEMLEKVFAIFGLSTAMIAVLMPRIQQSLQEKDKNGIISKIASSQNERTTGPAANGNGNRIAETSPDLSGIVGDEFSGAFRFE